MDKSARRLVTEIETARRPLHHHASDSCHLDCDNPFGFPSTNLGSIYELLVGDMTKNFKHLRKTRHTHHPVDDAKENPEALLAMRDGMELKIPLS